MFTIFLAYCGLLAIVLGLAIVVPFLRGRSDLLNTRALICLGGINFTAISGVMVYVNGSDISDFKDADYLWYMSGATVFYTAMLITYASWRLPVRMGGKMLLSWPPASPAALFVMIVCCLLPLLIPRGVYQFPVVGTVFNMAAIYAPIIAAVLSVSFWYQQKSNPIALGVMLGTLVFAVVMSLAVGSGRRWIVAVLLSVPITMYWLRLRSISRPKTMAYMLIGLVVAGIGVNGYTHVRHRGRSIENYNALLKIQAARENLLSGDQLNQTVGQDTAHVTLRVIRAWRERVFDPDPFHAVKFIVTNPIPRQYWPDKPLGLGYILGNKIFASRQSRATLGPGIVGHGFYEGGLHILLIYGVLVGGVLRFIDAMLENQPNNPYLLGWLVASSGQFLGWVRGDIGTFTIQIVAATVMVTMVVILGRLLMGSGLRYYTADVRTAAEYYTRRVHALQQEQQRSRN